MNPLEFTRIILEEPDMPEEMVGVFLWEYTGYPCFFRSKDPVREPAYQLRHAKRLLLKGGKYEAFQGW